MRQIRFSMLLIIFISLFCSAQNHPTPQKGVSSEIFMKTIGRNSVQYSATLPAIIPKAGPFDAFYTFFWEFGDGTFSDTKLKGAEKPEHQYKASGNYQVRLFATNNYANGPAPSAQKTFTIPATSTANKKWDPAFFDKGENIKIKTNRDPKPDEELVTYIGYRNRSRDNLPGSLVIFFNERNYYQQSFRLIDTRTYNGEERSSLYSLLSRISNRSARDMLEKQERSHMDNAVIHFNNLPKNESHFVFLTMQTLKKMERFLNYDVSITAILVPDDPSVEPEKFICKKQIRASHDPNRMLLNPNPINFRFGKKKELTYTVQFQNTGKGPSNNISIGIALPRQLNSSSLQIKGMSPQTAWCDSLSLSDISCLDTIRTSDSLYFKINNIHLPGLREESVTNENVTKGFVEYSLRFKKRPKKKPFSSRAVIVFDANKPVITNEATARFIKGMSPGIIAGYNLSISNGNHTATGPFQLGYVLAPYAPYRPYFQIEAHSGILQQEDSEEKGIKPTTQSLNGLLLKNFVIDTAKAEMDILRTQKRNTIQFIPLHFRYNLSHWIGLGIGMIGQLVISEQNTSSEKYYLSGYDTNEQNKSFNTVVTRTNRQKTEIGTKLFSKANLASFADMQIGRVRTGPTLGLRYIRQWQGDIRNRFFLYAAFKL